MNLCCVSDDDDEVRAFQLKWHSDSVREERKEQWDGRKKSLFSRCRAACCEVWVRRGKNRYKTAEVKNNSEISKEVFRVTHFRELFSIPQKLFTCLAIFWIAIILKGNFLLRKKKFERKTQTLLIFDPVRAAVAVCCYIYVSKKRLFFVKNNKVLYFSAVARGRRNLRS